MGSFGNGTLFDDFFAPSFRLERCSLIDSTQLVLPLSRDIVDEKVDVLAREAVSMSFSVFDGFAVLDFGREAGEKMVGGSSGV